MKRTWWLAAGAILVAGWGLGLSLRGLSAQGVNFDKLAAEDRTVFQKRFEEEIWPLLQRNGKDGCVGCHSGKLVSALKLKGDAAKDFAMLLREGFFLPDDAGSLLGRITDPDPQRRMPMGKRAWSAEEVAKLRTFVNALDKKQGK